MTESRINQSLEGLFDKRRIVFWYDANHDFRDEFESLKLSGVETIELSNNEFGVKYRILRKQPEQKFLLYRDGAEPEHLNNWLLDVQLASGEFRTDRVGLWASELELGPADHVVVSDHLEFFASNKRRAALKKRLQQADSRQQIRLKLLAVCTGCEPHLAEIIERLLAELAHDEDECFKLIERSGLQNFLWQQLQRHYGYESDQPGLKDFVIELFKNSFLAGVDADHKPTLTAESLLFLRRWKDSRSNEAAFEVLSADCADILDIRGQLEKLDYRALGDLDYFELIDRKLLSDLVHAVASRSISARDVDQAIRRRREGHWFNQFKDVYFAVRAGAQLLHQQDKLSLQIDSLADGIAKYAESWFELDQLYRRFVYHLRKSGQTSLLNDLAEEIENRYSNDYLTLLNDGWQQHVDNATYWLADGVTLQREFAQRHVQPFLDRGNKVCVLISDALRYEIGAELQGLIRQQDKYVASLEPMLSMLPSFTQLGMAALLPNTELRLNDEGEAFVDGQSATGTANRGRILAQSVANSSAVQAKDVLGMNRTDARALIRDNDVIYVYHNLIDKTGDTRDTEERVFVAAQEALDEIVRLIKKLFNANASHVLVTADHGFIYQDRPLQDSDYLSETPQGESITHKDRRFILGTGLGDSNGLKTLSASDLGLAGELEVQIPKSTHRLRLKGSGSRYVHGGASLQEVVIPLLHVSKTRVSDVDHVTVEVLGGGAGTITTGQLTVVLYQRQPVSDKRLPRTLRVGLYSLAGELLSDTHELTFDYTSDNARERECRVRLLLGQQAGNVNNQQVELRLDEPVEGTSHSKRYQTATYTIRRSFTDDFDF